MVQTISLADALIAAGYPPPRNAEASKILKLARTAGIKPGEWMVLFDIGGQAGRIMVGHGRTRESAEADARRFVREVNVAHIDPARFETCRIEEERARP